MGENKNNKVAFLTLGCKVNSYETDAMETLFIDAGYEIKEFNEEADIYIINTCTVTNVADHKSRQMLHKAKKKNKDAIIVAVGCYVQASGETLEKDKSIDILVGNNKKKDIVTIIENYRKDSYSLANRKLIIDIDKEKEYEQLKTTTIGDDRTRAYIKIQDGCNQFCSYCIIPYTRGRIRSRNKDEVLEEINILANKGYKEVVLTGIHLSSYGIDLGNDNLLLELISDIENINEIKRIRLGSLEPRIITKEFATSLAKCKKICPHFHLSLQSGNDDTLKRMNRKYTTKEYKEKCDILRKYFDNPALTTDVIVGFPGETDEEFEKTIEYLNDISFAQMHIFKYSKRHGTVACNMENQVDEQIKNLRSAKLLDLDLKLREEYKKCFLNKEENVLIEETIEINNENYVVGHNERYLKIAAISKKDLTNEIVTVKLDSSTKEEILFGKI